jgi:hypothetical protein
MSTSANTSDNPSFEDVEGYDTERLINYLRRTKFINLGEEDYNILREQSVNGHAFVYTTRDEFREPPYNFGHGKVKNLCVLIDRLNSESKFYHNIVYVCTPRTRQLLNSIYCLFLRFTCLLYNHILVLFFPASYRQTRPKNIFVL